MKWIAISGSWRIINKKVEKDIRKVVKDILARGDGIVTGGALNVDYIATDETLKYDLSANRIKVFLPTTLEIYARHYHKRAKEGVITEKQAEDLINQLELIKKLNHLSFIENTVNKVVDKKTYFERNKKVIQAADELVAFHVNESEGVADTIEKAKKKGIPVRKFVYVIK